MMMMAIIGPYDLCLSPRVTKDWNPLVVETTESACNIIMDITVYKARDTSLNGLNSALLFTNS